MEWSLEHVAKGQRLAKVPSDDDRPHHIRFMHKSRDPPLESTASLSLTRQTSEASLESIGRLSEVHHSQHIVHAMKISAAKCKASTDTHASGASLRLPQLTPATEVRPVMLKF